MARAETPRSFFDVFRMVEPKKSLGVLLALSAGATIWNMAPPEPLDQNGIHFLAVLTAAVVLWVFEVFEEHIVALMLLLAWLVLSIVPSSVALGGFSKNSWIFIVAALGIGATVSESGLLYRLGAVLLRKCPPDHYKRLTFILLASAFVTTPFLPGLVRARATLMATLSNAISKTIGLVPRSNGSARFGLSAYMACGQLSFIFLTGAGYSLVSWSLLPEAVKADFGWVQWIVAAFPAGIVTFLLLYTAINFFFPLKEEDLAAIAARKTELQAENLGPLTPSQSLTLVVLLVAIAGWLTKPWHGINEAWVALGALLFYLSSGALDRKTFKNGIDWGLILFFGIVNSLAAVAMHLKIDRWLVQLMTPLLSLFSFHPMAFLLVIVVIVYLTRLFLRKMPAAIVLAVVLIPWASRMGMHPGILLITILIALEFLVLPYQDGPYQIFYSSSEGESFSHGQARKLMMAKFVASFVAVAISVPYWSWLGYIQAKPSLEASTANIHQGLALAPHQGLAPARGNFDPQHAVIEPHPGRQCRNDVASIQRLLSKLGFDPGPVDGIVGRHTRAAIRRYQIKKSLPGEAEPSPVLLTHLETHSTADMCISDKPPTQLETSHAAGDTKLQTGGRHRQHVTLSSISLVCVRGPVSANCTHSLP